MSNLIEVNCFGTTKFKLGEKLIRRQVTTFNEALQVWEDGLCIEFNSKCPVCKTDILVRIKEGVTWLACCSESCYKTYRKLRDEGRLNILWENKG